jgi:hypothetical protein
VRDLRGQRRARVAGGLGLGGIVLAALLAYMTGGNPLDAVFKAVMSGGLGDAGASVQTAPREPTPEEKELEVFATQVLAGTEDVWKKIFAEMGWTYEEPTLTLFTDEVSSGCGGATKQTGPFYCSADRSVYLDLSFFTEMKDKLGAGGDFAYAYVIGHEVGHHVQNLLGTLEEAHRKMARMDKESANRESVRLELQADFLAGVWAHHDNDRFHSLEKGDIEKGLKCAAAIGDDHLQDKAGMRVRPETFTHGTSAARVRWFEKGWKTGDLRAGDTFSVPFEDL